MYLLQLSAIRTGMGLPQSISQLTLLTDFIGTLQTTLFRVDKDNTVKIVTFDEDEDKEVGKWLLDNTTGIEATINRPVEYN